MNRFPSAARLLLGGAVVIPLVVVIAAGVRGRDAVAALEAAVAAEGAARGRSGKQKASKPRDEAPVAELATAKVQGPEALEALAGRYPKDPAVLRALFQAYSTQGGAQKSALAAARRLLAVEPDAADDADLRRVVLSAAGGPKEVASEAFDLMAEGMGSEGLDLLYDLAVKSPSLKERALRRLAEPAALERASPALKIAYELRTASSCNARKPLLERAAKEGDQRAVEVLAPLMTSKGKGCGFLGMSRCPAPCAAIAGDIRKAVEAIEARPGTTSAPASP